MSEGDAKDGPEKSSSPAPKPVAGPLPLPGKLAYLAAVVSGLLYWLAFPGRSESAWPGLLAFVAFIPLWIALQGQAAEGATWIGVVTGATMNLAGFSWLLAMLETFSGFPWYFCLFFVVVVCAYQGGRLGLMGWLYARASSRGWPRVPVFLGAFAASELLYPLLFPWYFAATTHNLPALSQTAELGGPILVGVVLVAANVALREPLLARLERRASIARTLALPAAAVALSLVFSAWRIPAIDARAQASEPVH